MANVRHNCKGNSDKPREEGGALHLIWVKSRTPRLSGVRTQDVHVDIFVL